MKWATTGMIEIKGRKWPDQDGDLPPAVQTALVRCSCGDSGLGFDQHGLLLPYNSQLGSSWKRVAAIFNEILHTSATADGANDRGNIAGQPESEQHCENLLSSEFDGTDRISSDIHRNDDNDN